MPDPKKPLGKNTPALKLTAIKPQNEPDVKNSLQPESWRMGLSSDILGNSALSDESAELAWLSDLKQESSDFIKTRSGNTNQKAAQDAINRQGIDIVLDRLFSCMQGYMYEFNKVAIGTDLHVSGTISGEVTEVTRVNKFREAEITQTYFRARLSTRIFSLVLRGSQNKIDFFLLPVTRAMALSTIENEYSPLATIEIKVGDKGLLWRPIRIDSSCNSLESLCAWSFKQLITETRAAVAGKQ